MDTLEASRPRLRLVMRWRGLATQGCAVYLRQHGAKDPQGALPIRTSLTTTLRPSTPGNYAQLLMHTNWRLTDA